MIVGMDGLQPAQVTPELTPNLAAWASDGVTFENHHAVFPTVTRSNVVSMLTGRYPGGHGLAANNLVVRDCDPHHFIPAMRHELTEVADKTGRVLLESNLADILGANGMEFVAVGTGSSGNVFLQNHNAARAGGATIHPEFCLPEGLHKELESRFGPWPDKRPEDEKRLARAVQVLTEYVLGERRPAIAILWFSDPDGAQHAAGVGSGLAVRSLAAADRQFGSLLVWLDQSDRDVNPDVIVVSDHGYSTITGTVDVEGWVRGAGFPPGDMPGGVVVAPNGGSVLFYVHSRDRATADRLVARLMEQPWCGLLFAAEAVWPIPGTFPLSLVGSEGPRAPDLTMSFTWDSTPNEVGFPGHIYCAAVGPIAPGLSVHGSMSRHEQRSVLIASGPSFKSGVALTAPSGNVDLAPTVLSILRIPGGEEMDGRPLYEALTDAPEHQLAEAAAEVSEAEPLIAGGLYLQRVTVSRTGKTTYVVEGSAGVSPA